MFRMRSSARRDETMTVKRFRVIAQRGWTGTTVGITVNEHRLSALSMAILMTSAADYHRLKASAPGGDVGPAALTCIAWPVATQGIPVAA